MAGKFFSFTFAATFWLFASLTIDQPLANAQELEVVTISGQTMGTTYQVKYALPVADNLDADNLDAGNSDAGNSADGNSGDAKQLQARIDKRLAAINASMSTYLNDSEITRFNESESSSAFEVSSDFRRVAARALELNRLTDGRFDVTVGPLVRFWGFGGGTAPEKIPTRDQIQDVLNRVGSNHFSLDSAGVKKSLSDLEIDFSAIAKGYAVDEVSRLVDEVSDHFMVEIGGEVRTKGRNPVSEQAWAIGVELPGSDPLASSRELAARIELSDQALATSGNYRNFVLIEDKKFQHTIDPTTGYPVDLGILSVSVVADDCMTADGLATGMMVFPMDEIKNFCAENQVAAFVIFRDDSGKIDWWKSDLFTGEVMLKPVVSNRELNPVKEGGNPLYLILGTVVVFGLAISGMAVGVIMSNRQLKGSCGGLSAMSENGEGDASPCSLCTKPASECSKRSEQEAAEATPAE